MKSRVILLLALFFFIIPFYAHAGTGLKITHCEADKFFGEPPYILLSYDYPQDLKKSGVEITVNGQKAFFEPNGGGFGGGMTSESVLLYPGPPGKKQIKIIVRAGDKVLSATQTIDFRSSGDILLLNRSNGEAILSSDPEFRFFGYFFQNLKIKLNGDYLKFHQEPLKVSADHFQIICKPEMHPGENTLDLNWESENGQSKSKQYHFYLAKNGVIKQGDRIEVRLGRLQSKTGPFYYAAIKGNSLQGETGPIVARQISWQNYYLSQDLLAMVVVKAEQPGKGVVEVYKKEVFYNPPEINRRIDLTVVK